MTSASEADSGVAGTVEAALARGNVAFMGLELVAAEGALVARKETETLAQTAIRLIKERSTGGEAQVVIDMCTGSGNLACAIAHHVPDARVFASDLTDGCVSCARKNVETLGLGERVSVFQGDLFGPLRALEGDASLLGKVDVVVCNPPYISTSKLEGDRAALLEKEPREAFDGGPYGIAIHQRVVKDALDFLKPGGLLAFEIGAGQAKQVTILFGRARGWEEVSQVNDSNGEARVLFSRKKPV